MHSHPIFSLGTLLLFTACAADDEGYQVSRRSILRHGVVDGRDLTEAEYDLEAPGRPVHTLKVDLSQELVRGEGDLEVAVTDPNTGAEMDCTILEEQSTLVLGGALGEQVFVINADETVTLNGIVYDSADEAAVVASESSSLADITLEQYVTIGAVLEDIEVYAEADTGRSPKLPDILRDNSARISGNLACSLYYRFWRSWPRQCWPYAYLGAILGLPVR
jgi:hypothetical protein